MDTMQDYEVNTIIDNLGSVDRINWEQTRLIMYSVIQSQSRKQLKPKDILKFDWDTDTTSISNDEVERLRKLSKQFEKIILNE